MFRGRTQRGAAGSNNDNGAAIPYRYPPSPSIAAYGQSVPSGSHQNLSSLSSNFTRNNRRQNSQWGSAPQYGSGEYGSDAWNQPSSSAPYDSGPSYNSYSLSSDYNRGALRGPPLSSYGMGSQRASMSMLDNYDSELPSHSLNSANVGSTLRPSGPLDSSFASYDYNESAPYGHPSHRPLERSSFTPTEREAELAISILSTVLKDKAVEPVHQRNPPFQMVQEEDSFQFHKRGNMKRSQQKKRKFDAQNFSQDYGDAGPADFPHTSIKRRLSGPGLQSAYKTQPVNPPMDKPNAQQHGHQNMSMSQPALGNKYNVSEEKGTKIFDGSRFKFKCKNIPQNPLSLEDKQKDISAKAARGVSSRCLKCHICDENNFDEVQNFHEHLESSSHDRLVKKYVEKLSAAYVLMALDVQMVSRRQCIKEVYGKIPAYQIKGKYYGLFWVVSKCKICQVPKILKHESLREVKILHDFVKPQCLVCDMKFTNRISYEEHKLTVSHLMNVWEQEEDTSKKSEFWSKLKVEYLKRFGSIGKSIENVENVKMKNVEKDTDLNDECDVKVKEEKEDVSDKADNDDYAVKKETEDGATANESKSQEQNSEEMSENERNEVVENDESKELTVIGINKAEEDPENNEESIHQEEYVMPCQPQTEESSAPTTASGLRKCAYAGCDKQHTSEDPHAYCIQHDACMKQGTFDPENCPTCMLWVTPLQGLPMNEIRTMNQYRRLKTRWNRARKSSKSHKPRWYNLKLMIELGFISKESAKKLGSASKVDNPEMDLTPKKPKPAKIKSPILSSEKELFMLRERYPTVKSFEEMLMQPYAPDVPFGVNFLINQIEAYCVSCRSSVGYDTDCIEKHCKSRHHYQSLKKDLSNKDSKAEKGNKIFNSDDIEDRQMKQEDSQPACESDMPEGEGERTENESVKCLNLELEGRAEDKEVGEEEVDDDFGDLIHDVEEEENEFEGNGEEEEEVQLVFDDDVEMLNYDEMED